MPTFYLTRGTGLVSSLPYDQNAAQAREARGTSAIRLIVQDLDAEGTATPVFLDADHQAGIMLRDPDDWGADTGTGPIFLTRGATPADGYIGTVSTDSSYVRVKMQVGDPNAAQLSRYDLSAVVIDLPPAGQALQSAAFDWTVTPRYYDPGTPPLDIIETFPSAAQLNAAVASVANKQAKLPTPTSNGLYLRGNTDGTFTFSSFPSSVTGNWNVAGILNVTGTSDFVGAMTLEDDLTVNGDIHLAATIYGDGSGLENLNPARLSAPVDIAHGGTGAATAAAARTALGAEAAANKGAANGYAPLDGSQKIPAANLPSYVDDVLEFANLAALPSTGESGKIYVTLDTNFEYRWSGSTYIRLVPSPGSTDALAEGSTNLYFTAARALAATDSAYLKPNGSAANLTNSLKAHPILTGAGGISGNGVTISTAGCTLLGSAGIGSDTDGLVLPRLSDTVGTIILQFSANAYPGDTVANITFATPYSGTLPLDVMFVRVELPHTYSAGSPGGSSGYVPTLEARMSSTQLHIYASGDGVASGSTLAYRYYIPPQQQ